MTDLINAEAALTPEMEASYAALAASLGAGPNKSTSTLARFPVLSIMSNEDDMQGNAIKPDPRGKFYLKGSEKLAFAVKATFRPLSHHYQFIHFDDSGLVNKSRAVIELKEEARDMLGTIKCGRPAWTAILEMDREEKKRWRDMQFRQVRGLVTMSGKTADGEEVVYQNTPCMLQLRNSNYGGFKNSVQDRVPVGRNLFDFNVELSSERNVNGSVKWYTFNYKPDFANPIPPTMELFETLQMIKDMIDKENEYVDEAYYKAISAGSIDAQAIAAIAQVEDSLDDDLTDAA